MQAFDEVQDGPRVQPLWPFPLDVQNWPDVQELVLSPEVHCPPDVQTLPAAGPVQLPPAVHPLPLVQLLPDVQLEPLPPVQKFPEVHTFPLLLVQYAPAVHVVETVQSPDVHPVPVFVQLASMVQC